MEENIKIKGARVNNLKNIDLEIPRDKLVVVTGVSGSGKSSLAFDTLYAEGQRRYVESLSSYARQFLGRMQKPECDYIKGIPPSIAIEQKVSSRNPRSTVGTSTEIYDYLRLLFARIGRTFSPISGKEVRKHTTEDVIQTMLTYGRGTKFAVLCPLHVPEGRTLLEQLEMELKAGFVRVEVDSEILRIEDLMAKDKSLKAKDSQDLSHLALSPSPINLVIDRLTVSDEKDVIARLVDSAETAFYEGNGEMMLRFYPAGILHAFSMRFEADGITFEEPSDKLFAFNSPAGACPECEGFGRIVGIDEQLVVPNSALSVYEGAVMPWRGEKLSEWKNWFIRFNSERGFPVHKPYFQLSREEKDWLWHGTFPARLTPEQRRLAPEEEEWGVVSIDAFFDYLREGQYKIQNRVMLARYRGKTLCPKCHGTRLKPEANYVKVGGRSITDLVDLPITELKRWFDDLQLTEQEERIAQRIMVEIRNRLGFLLDVGLGYLTLNRLSNSLSGGESQRINLATSLGSSLVGSLYILDEPSIGLHSRDTQRLINVLRQLRDLGNTVIVVEHDEEIMRAADWLIDIGPDAGRLGGQVVYQGPPILDIQSNQSTRNTRNIESHTLAYLNSEETLPVPQSRRPWNNYIEVKGARANNLKGIDVRFPLNVITCVTGVSGSGKSTLVKDILYLAMKRYFDEPADRPGEHLSLEGDMSQVRHIEFIDQNPIGKSTRSNPVTYVKGWDEIRKLFAAQPLAVQMGYTAGHFSFNTEGGRCEECKGEGTVTVEMQFMADLVLECESCHGRRFKNDILEVKFQGRDVCEILDMTVNQAIEFFTEHKQKRIVSRLKPLQDVGLGYIKLGQSSSTLSGGENQRVKLAYYLGQEKHEPTLFIFDEPTTGLHFHDIRKLMAAFDKLIAHGHTIVIIEHNLDVIKCADHVIDLGPDGGDRGGELVVQGTPEQVAACAASYTGQFLKDKLTKP
ncbi:MAG: excinuclease ABC subunit UvrA [Bacteroidaceae bacterium]|nr:excinuclease ABC subunit UvrA [Bacteroidaceae bacterium]